MTTEKRLKVGFALTGSYCTFQKVINTMSEMAKEVDIIPIFSDNSQRAKTRFGKGEEFVERIEEISKNKAIKTIEEAEPIGPKKLIDVLVIAPCTGNTIAKLANGIADTTVTLSAKSQLRNNRPVVIAISTNDGLGANAVNIGKLLARKNIYMVPFGQDDCMEKENSLISDFDKILPAIEKAVEGKQLQPILL